MKERPPSGVIINSYGTQAGETVWIIAWDDRENRPVTDIDADPDLGLDMRVELVGRRLRRRAS